jgi:hypothetical protein
MTMELGFLFFSFRHFSFRQNGMFGWIFREWPVGYAQLRDRGLFDRRFGCWLFGGISAFFFPLVWSAGEVSRCLVCFARIREVWGLPGWRERSLAPLLAWSGSAAVSGGVPRGRTVFGLKIVAMGGREMVEAIGTAEGNQHPLGLASREKVLHAHFRIPCETSLFRAR